MGMYELQTGDTILIRLEDLDGLKLVQSENFAMSLDVGRAVEFAIQQGSQGWGVKSEVAVLLSVALELRNALMQIERITPVANAAKGAQMELGRAKKKMAKLETQLNEALGVDIPQIPE